MARKNHLSIAQRLTMLEKIKSLTIGEAQHLATELILSYQGGTSDEFEPPERVYESLKSPPKSKPMWEAKRDRPSRSKCKCNKITTMSHFGCPIHKQG